MCIRERRRQRGVTLVEVVMFIVIVGAGLAGVLSVYRTATAKSGDPVVRKQALAIAESLLEEVELMPFTWCDPDDPAAATAASEAACATREDMGNPGPETAQGESRYSATAPFDNVNDYHGFTMNGIRDLAGNAIAGLEAYAASVSVTRGGLGMATPDDVARIAVTVNGPGNESVTLHGYRVRHSPNALP